MGFKGKLARINELAKKAKQEGLTADEKKEQQELREDYVRGVRESFTEQFKTMTVVDPEGTDVTPDKVRELQRKNKKQ